VHIFASIFDVGLTDLKLNFEIALGKNIHRDSINEILLNNETKG